MTSNENLVRDIKIKHKSEKIYRLYLTLQIHECA